MHCDRRGRPSDFVRIQDGDQINRHLSDNFKSNESRSEGGREREQITSKGATVRPHVVIVSFQTWYAIFHHFYTVEKNNPRKSTDRRTGEHLRIMRNKRKRETD